MTFPSILSLKAILVTLATICLYSGEVSRADDPGMPFGQNVQLRGSLDNAPLQFRGQKKGRVAFLGGSITEMDGYRPMVSELLKKRFPETEFTFINAGISSTCSTTGAFRLSSDVLSKGPIDLLFVEFAVNDDQDAAHSKVGCIRGMEGIIRQARAANPSMDIVITFFVNEGMIETFHKGGNPLSIEAHDAVAKHYDISSINLAREVAEEIASGRLTWKQYGGVHPAPHGNAIAARMIDELFTRAWKNAPRKNESLVAHPLPAASIDPLSYGRGRFVDLSQAQLKEGWSLGVPDWKKLPGSKRERFTSLPMLEATRPDAELSLNFEGTSVGAYVVAGPDAGIAEVSIDGGSFQQVNLYHQHSSGLHYPRTVLLGTDLTAGSHSLVLRMAKETRSAGHAMRIIQFAVN